MKLNFQNYNAGLRWIVAPENLYSRLDWCLCCVCLSADCWALSPLLTVLAVPKTAAHWKMKSNLVIALQSENDAESKCLHAHCDLVCSLENSICGWTSGREQTADPSCVVVTSYPPVASARHDQFVLQIGAVKGKMHKHALQRTCLKTHCWAYGGDFFSF